MYKVLIIDDELLVRVGLKTTIDWEKIGFTVVAEASNGEQGYEQYIKHTPNVIITDIKMPKRDGFWLINRIRKENKDVKILVLTCYDEFSYVRKALKIGADDYILKSEVEDEELITIMKSIKNKIYELQKTKKIQNKVKINRNDIRRNLLNDMIKTNFNINDRKIKQCSKAEFNIFNTKFVFANVVISEETIKNITDERLKHINNAIINIVFDKLSERGIEYIYNDFIKKYMFLMSAPKLTLSELKKIFDSVNNAASQYFNISLNIVYTTPFDDINDIYNKYKDFIDKIQILFYKNKKSFFIVDTNNVSFKDVNVFELKKQYNMRFDEYIGLQNIDEINELIYEVSNYFEKHNINPMKVKIFYSNLIGDIFNNYGQMFNSNDKTMNYEYYYYKILKSENLKNIDNLLLEFLNKVIKEIALLKYNNSKLIIRKALNYIHNNYDKKISLKDVACELNLSKHYLCNVFKNEKGENMSLYINKLRIEKAKKILLKTDCKIKNIFDEVGFSNQQYFSKVFKKITGMTIMEYKERKNRKII